MATIAKPTSDWKTYEQERPKLSIRITRDDKEALDTVLRRRGESITELLMAYLRPIITEGSPEGQRAHDIISTAVQQSVAWNRTAANNGFGDTTPALNINGEEVTEWAMAPNINIRQRITKDGDPVMYHAVEQRQGMTRQASIQRHVSMLMDAWAQLPDDQRDAFLSEITNKDRHRFRIAFVGMQHWTQFTEAYEMRFHYEHYQAPFIATPASDDESAFVQWASIYLMDRWNDQRKKRKTPPMVTLNDGTSSNGVTFNQSFRHYAINTDAENVDAWAGLWLNRYRQNRAAGLDHNEAIEQMAQERITVQKMTITDE